MIASPHMFPGGQRGGKAAFVSRSRCGGVRCDRLVGVVRRPQLRRCRQQRPLRWHPSFPSLAGGAPRRGGAVRPRVSSFRPRRGAAVVIRRRDSSLAARPACPCPRSSGPARAAMAVGGDRRRDGSPSLLGRSITSSAAVASGGPRYLPASSAAVTASVPAPGRSRRRIRTATNRIIW